MNGRKRYGRFLRWYPASWRQRYGDELVALLEDTYGDRPVPLRCRMSLVRAGAVERWRGSGLAADSDESRGKVRSGSLLVLCAWSVFVVAGAGFAKFAEHWDAATPPGDRPLPAAAYDAVQWAAGAGGLIVLVAAASCLPAFARSMRDGDWTVIRRPVLRAMVVTVVTAAATLGIVVWAHHLGTRQRNGASTPYLGLGALWALLMVASIVCCTAAAVAAASRLRFTARMLRIHGALALAVTIAMVVVIGGTLVWWGAVASSAPWFFGSGVTGSATSPVPASMVAAGILMVLGLATAVVGAGRVARSIRGVPSD
jgi:hypothetical protein